METKYHKTKFCIYLIDELSEVKLFEGKMYITYKICKDPYLHMCFYVPYNINHLRFFKARLKNDAGL